MEHTVTLSIVPEVVPQLGPSLISPRLTPTRGLRNPVARGIGLTTRALGFWPTGSAGYAM